MRIELCLRWAHAGVGHRQLLQQRRVDEGARGGVQHPVHRRRPLALHGGQLPGTINCAKVATDCPVNVQVGSRAVTKPAAVKISLTDVGQIAVAVIRTQAIRRLRDS